MRNARTLSWRFGMTLGCTLLALLIGSCGAKPSASDAATPDSGESPQTDSGPSGPLDATTPPGADAALATTDAGGDVEAPEPLFEGIPYELIKDVPPKGCVGKPASRDTLVLELDVAVNALRLAAHDGKIIANQKVCDATSVRSIKITGSTANDTVIIDGSQGDFPAALRSAAVAITIDLAAGKDTVAVMGTLGDDRIGLGTLDAKTVLQASSALPKISIVNSETLIVSAGPGSDRIEAVGGQGLGTALAVALQAYGGADDDALSGGAKDDELHGGSGDDSFETAAKPDGGDTYDGGPGIDSLSYAARTAAVSVKINQSPDDGEAGEKDNVWTSIENLTGGSGADTLTGSPADNTFIGGPGNDTLNGGDGNDMFMEVEAQAGTDIVNGGDGSDTIDYSGRHTAMSVSLCLSAQPSCAAGACGCPADDGEADERDTLTNLENVSTGSGNDTLIGNANGNYFNAGAGNDMLIGMAGDDNLYGESGNDTLEGGAGDDLLDGSEGLDTFDGGDGDGDICVLQAKETQKACELH
jgi:Ca2+-binding RTX toxin-like protein